MLPIQNIIVIVWLIVLTAAVVILIQLGEYRWRVIRKGDWEWVRNILEEYRKRISALRERISALEN